MPLGFSILFLSYLLILAQFNSYSDGQLLNSSCTSTDTYDIGSTFQSNLFKLLSSLSSDALTNSGFSNKSFGNSPDDVYGLVMCVNDYSTADCASCIQSITSNTTNPCPMKATATVWYAQCTLSYSNKDFLSVADPYEPYCLSAVNYSLDKKSETSLMNVLTNLSATTPYTPEMFATQVVNGTDMSAFIQCTRDLSSEECEKCINYTMSNYFDFCSDSRTTLGMRIFAKNCYIRYESYVLNVSSFPKLLVLTPPSTLVPPSPLPSASPVSGSKSNSTVIIATSVVVILIVASCAAIGFCFWRKKRSSHRDTNDDDEDSMLTIYENVEPELQYILNPNAEYHVYKFTTLKIATENFSDMNKLGKGGFGPVYKGILPGGQEIAVKRLSGCSAQGLTEFKNEVEFLAKLKHKNLVELLGCCIQDKEKLLCYEYLPNGSLDKILFARDAYETFNFGWEMRRKIIEGITRGLHYLHEESRLKIMHRDLKASNILLDKDMNPKISDFGLARFFEEDQTHIDTSIIAGTFGYMAPEYVLHGNFSAKSDVYSFGVLLLEIVTGQKNSSFSGSNRISNLIRHAMMHWNNDTISELKDQMLEEEFNQEVKRYVHIALLCVQENPSDRPNMETVKNMLATPSMTIPSLPSTLSLSWLTDDGRDSMTTGTSTVRSQAESFTTSTWSVGSDVESSGTKSFTKGI